MTGPAVLASILLFAICAVLRPHAAQCPGDMDLRTGVRVNGAFACWPHPVGDPEWDGTWQRPERSVQASWVLEGRVYCVGSERAVVENWHRVGCR